MGWQGESLRETEEEKGWVARREEEGVAKERVVIEGVSEDYEEVL